jgi:signal transduction histidine kinase
MNARKHSSARQLWIEFTEQPEGLRLLIRDDGCGFDPEKSPKGHYGLLYMKERIEACGGELRVHSAPGAGTEIQAVVPRKQD